MQICVTKLIHEQGLRNELNGLEEKDKGKYFLSAHDKPGRRKHGSCIMSPL